MKIELFKSREEKHLKKSLSPFDMKCLVFDRRRSLFEDGFQLQVPALQACRLRACELGLALYVSLLCFTCLENTSISVSLLACWDVFPDPRMLPVQLRALLQLTKCITTGNLNCELRFIPNPVRGEGGSEEGGKLYFVCVST